VPTKEIIHELKSGLEKRYGSRLKGVVLFGSYARGEETKDSDIDIAVILEDFDHACIEIERTGDLVSSVSLKFDTSSHLPQ
jgi:predicted nucleotidyltransferase